MKIPFDIKYRPQIESGEYTVETRDGVHATILEWDIFIHGMAHMMLIRYNDKYEFVHSNGRINRTGQDCNLDLFIVTPEEELSEFEIRLLDWLSDDTSGEIPMERMKEVVRNRAAELLSLARGQFIKDGYVIEKKAFNDAVEKVSSEIMKEVSVKKDEIFERRRQTLPTSGEVEGIVKSAIDYMRGFSDGASTYIPKDMKEALRTEYEKGRAEALKDLEESGRVHCKSYDIGYDDGARDALKDLPRWNDSRWIYEDGWLQDGFLYYRNHSILLKDLEKLPGFKDDSHE